MKTKQTNSDPPTSGPPSWGRRSWKRFATAGVLALGMMLCVGVDASAQAVAGAVSPMLSGPRPAPIEAPSAAALEESIDQGVEFLLGNQNRDGSWGTPRRTKSLNIYAPVPGAHQAFRAAVTSLCLSALMESGRDDDRVEAAIERGETWLFEHLPRVRRATPDAIYNVWTHIYSLQTLALLAARHEGDEAYQDRIREQIAEQIDRLERYESIDGGWGYYDFRAGTKRPSSSSTSFVSAAALIALKDVEPLGVEPPAGMVERAVDSLHRQQKSDYSYLYGEYLWWSPMHPVNRPGGSLGRSQACNVALRLWGDEQITEHVLTVWLDRLFARNLWLDIGRKRPVPHEAWFSVAGYFYYFGHYYAALVIEELPVERRPEYQARLARTLMRLQEKDGSWWDFPFYDYHQQYGTAMAVMSLVRCRAADDGLSSSNDSHSN